MKIVNLKAENFKRIVAVEIAPDGNTVILSGKNGAGKSSVLDCIVAALCGKKYIPEKPIRDGEDRAEIVLETDKFIVTRTFTEKGTQLKITNSEGMTASSPQSLLDSIVGDISFDPTEFIRMDAKKQRAMLMELTGVTFDDIDEQLEQIKAQRSLVLNDKKNCEHERDRITVVEGIEPVDVKELTAKIEEANSINAKATEATHEHNRLKREYEIADREYSEVLNELREAEARLEKLQEKREAKSSLRTSLKAEIDQHCTCQSVDLKPLQDKLAEAGETNRLCDAQNRRKEYEQAAAEKAAEYTALGQKAKEIESQKATRLSQAKMPVDGLSVDDSGVVYEGIPLGQVNSAKQLEIAVAISMALNPKLRVIRMGGNDLDSDSLKAISKLAEDNDYQVWVEKINENEEVGICIVEGEVYSVDGKKTKTE